MSTLQLDGLSSALTGIDEVVAETRKELNGTKEALADLQQAQADQQVSCARLRFAAVHFLPACQNGVHCCCSQTSPCSRGTHCDIGVIATRSQRPGVIQSAPSQHPVSTQSAPRQHLVSIHSVPIQHPTSTQPAPR